MTKKWIAPDSKVSLAEMISVWASEVFPFWDRNLETALKCGAPSNSLYQEFDNKPEAWQSFNSFEMAIANWLRGPLLSTVKLSPATKRLFDVGGGHGLYSIVFSQNYPSLKATIIDRTIDFFSLAYLVTVGGQCFTLKELGAWLQETGFSNVKTTLRLPGLVRAMKSA
jgi:hypothetical protein